MPTKEKPLETKDSKKSSLLHSFIWNKWVRKFIPNRPEQQMEELLSKLRSELPTPCLLLMGEPQVGKSSVVRSLTGDPKARVGFGDGIPVTEEIQSFQFPPAAEIPIWTFLDMPGLGAIERDIEEQTIQKLFSGKLLEEKTKQVIPSPHMILVCVRADDQALSIKPWLQKIQELQEGTALPVLIVQTCLHRLLHPHPMPYPFGKQGNNFPENLPSEAKQALQEQRAQLLEVVPQAQFVIVDLTDPEDEVGDPFYGAHALLEATFELLPEAVSQILQSSEAEFDRLYAQEAETLIWSYSSLASVAGALPPPIGDLATGAIAVTMARQIAYLYGQEWESKAILGLVWSLGSTTLAWILLRYLSKRLPIPVLMAPVGAAGAFGLLYSFGKLMSWYYGELQEGIKPKDSEIKKYWEGLQEETKEQIQKAMKKMWKKDSPVQE